MKRSLTLSLSILCCILLPIFNFAQLPGTCSFNDRIIVAGDSWAQYMADDEVHKKMLSAYGQGDKGAVSETFSISIVCPAGSPALTAYAVSGSEARQWADTDNFNYLNALIAELNDNTSIDHVVLSIGGNDFLAGRSEGGWYKNMDLDNSGSELALINSVKDNTSFIMEEVWANVNPNIKFIISSYDWPNFNVTGSFLLIDYCDQFACPKRADLSRDDNGDGTINPSELVSDFEINNMMQIVEASRIALADDDPRVFFDNGVGLTQYYYGYAGFDSGNTPYPLGQQPHTPGGNASYPTDRDNFRGVAICGAIGSFNADPIHLSEDAYEYKVKNQFDNIFFEEFRGIPDATFWSTGSEDGYVDVLERTATSNGIRVGDEDTGLLSLNREFKGILSFNTASLPDNAIITGASIYIMRSSENGNPFLLNDRSPVLDIKNGYFGGSPSLVWTDGNDVADASDIGCFHGVAEQNKYAIRIDVNPPAFDHFNTTGTTQFRMSFDLANWFDDYISFYDGGGAAPTMSEEERERHLPDLYENRSVKYSFDANGNRSEEVLSRGNPVIRRKGYTYKEKVIESKENEEGDIIANLKVMVTIEHPGLSKFMSDNFSAPANGLAPFIDVTYILGLPVELTAFNARAEDKNALLDWSSASEQNSKGYFIEHSINTKDWKEIGFVDSKGNSSLNQDYTFTHTQPINGINYYRLRMVDLDESFEYSPTRSVTFGKDNQLLVSPNPFNNRIDFEINAMTSEMATVQLIDILGKVVFENQFEISEGTNKYSIEDLSTIRQGTYALRISTSNKAYSAKVIKK